MIIEIIFKIFIFSIPALLILGWISNTARAYILRISFYKKLSKICDNNHYQIIRTRALPASFIMHSSKADLVVVTPNMEYDIRFVTCTSKSRSIHFPSPLFYVSSICSTHVMSGNDIHSFAQFRHLPPLREKDHGNSQKMQIVVFNPSPREITYINKEKTAKAPASNGTKYEDLVFFSASGFLDYLQSL